MDPGAWTCRTLKWILVFVSALYDRTCLDTGLKQGSSLFVWTRTKKSSSWPRPGQNKSPSIQTASCKWSRSEKLDDYLVWLNTSHDSHPLRETVYLIGAPLRFLYFPAEGENDGEEPRAEELDCWSSKGSVDFHGNCASPEGLACEKRGVRWGGASEPTVQQYDTWNVDNITLEMTMNNYVIN